MGPALTAEVPGVALATRIRKGWRPTALRYADRALYQAALMWADSTFFPLFSFPRVAGDLPTALGRKNSIVLSRDTARRLFGEVDPVGQVVALGLRQPEDYTVTGVVEVPSSSTLRFDLLVPFQNWSDSEHYVGDQAWGSGEVETFVRLADGTATAAVSAALPRFVEAHLSRLIQTYRSFRGRYELELRLQPLREIRYDATVVHQSWPLANRAYAPTLGIIALCILLIAAANFTNLSLGLSIGRLREVGMRRVLGASRRRLARQFLGEALFLSILALVTGVALTELLLPRFSALVDVPLHLDFASTWPALAGLAVVLGLLTGSYPALALSRLRPSEAVQGRLLLGSRSSFSRLLVVLQFACSIALVAVTLLISRQLDYVMARDLGFQPKQVVVVDASRLGWDGQSQRMRMAFRQLAAEQPAILGVSASGLRPGDPEGGSFSGQLLPRQGAPDLPFLDSAVDYDYLETVGLKVVAGRGFSRAFPGDVRRNVLINETMAVALGWPDPMGRVLSSGDMARALQMNSTLRGTIVGVVKDFNLYSLHRPVPPMTLGLNADDSLPYFVIRIRPDDVPATLSLLESVWRQGAPEQPFTYSFMDEDVAAQYRPDRRWQATVAWGAGLAAGIACLGALGLTALSVAHRPGLSASARCWGLRPRVSCCCCRGSSSGWW